MIYLYNGGFHHSKIMMVDDLFCTVGTANLNSRSLRYDYETNAFIFASRATLRVKRNDVFEADMLHCTRLTPEMWNKNQPGRSLSAGLRTYSHHSCKLFRLFL